MNNERLWTALIDICPISGLKFSDLVDSDVDSNYVGAWAKVLVKADSIIAAYNTIVAGIAEKQFVPVDFEYLDDYNHYKDSFEIGDDFINAEMLLHDTTYRFCIVGELFPYFS